MRERADYMRKHDRQGCDAAAERPMQSRRQTAGCTTAMHLHELMGPDKYKAGEKKEQNVVVW